MMLMLIVFLGGRMLVGLRNDYLGRLPQDANEKVVVRKVREQYSLYAQEVQRWQSFWQRILQNFYPDMDNIFNSSTSGVPRSNEVYTSHPSIFAKDYVDFMMKATFPESIPWFRSRFRDYRGLPIPRYKLDTQTLQFADDIVDAMRYWVFKSGFYDELNSTIMHDTLLGNSSMRCLLSEEDIKVKDTPIQMLAIGRDTAGRVHSVGEMVYTPDMEIAKKYGREMVQRLNKPASALKFSVNGVPAITAPTPSGMTGQGMFGTQMLGSNSANQKNSKRLIKFFFPNKDYADIPGGGKIAPEMDYLALIISDESNVILDVEAHPILPWGITRATTVQGESYGRGLGSLLLADVSVLNAKKRVEYQVDAIQSQSPIVIQGTGFVNPPAQSLRPFEKLHVYPNTKVAPLYQGSSLMQRAKASYETELESLGAGMRRDRIDIALADRMTASEYTHRKDASWGLFAPLAGRHYRQLGSPFLDNVLSWMIMTDKVPVLPQTLLNGNVKFEIETYSVLSYGQDSEVGQNINRAFGPLIGFIESNPEILDIFDTENFLRSNLSRFELSRFARSDEKVGQIREARAQMNAPGGGVTDPAMKAKERFLEGQALDNLQNKAVDDFVVV